MRWNRPVHWSAVALLLAACGGSSRQNGSAPAAAAAAPAGTTAAVMPAAPPGSAAAAPAPGVPMPASLEKAEGLAQDIQDDIQNGSWAAAQSKLSGLRTLTDTLSATGAASSNVGFYTASVDSLATAVRAHQRYPALQAANSMSRALTAMMAPYPTTVPIQVAYMDVAGRDGLYDAKQGHWGPAGDAVTEMRQNYGAVAAHVKQKSPRLDQRIRAEIAALQKAVARRSSARFSTQATKFLEDVDNVEKTY